MVLLLGLLLVSPDDDDVDETAIAEISS
jgi:hypothetical protein